MEALVAPPRPLRHAALPGWLRSSTVLTAVALAGIVAGAAALRVWALARQGFWYDEAMTARLVAEAPGQMLAALPHTESTPPLYYLLASGWVRLFGNTEAGLRSLSALAGTASVPVAFLAGRELSSRRAGLVAALLVAVNPLLVWYSQEARAYSLFVLATALSFWLFARAHARPSMQRLVAWGLVSALALCTHYFAVFVVAAEALLLLAMRRAPLRRRLAGVGIVVAAAGALAGLAWTQHTHARWQGVFALRIRAEQLPTQLLAGFTPPATRLALALIATAAALAVVLGLCLASRFERRGALLAVAVGGAAVLLPVGIAALGIDYVNTRNAIGAVVPIAVGLAVCAAARRAGVAGLGAAAVIAAVSVATVAAVPREAAAQRPHWRAVAAALAAPTSARRAILIRGSSSWALPLSHYLPRTWWVGPRGVRAMEVQVLRKLPMHPGCVGRSWWGATCSMRSRPALPTSPARGFRFASARRVAGFSITTYRATRPIRLYERPPLELPTRPHPGWHTHKLLFSPRAVPLVP